MANNAKWYAIKTEDACESRAHKAILAIGYESFYPTEKRRQVFPSGRWGVIERPLYPGYIFVRFDETADSWGDIVNCKWVSFILPLRTPMQPVPDSEIERVKLEVRLGLHDHSRGPEPGQHVRIKAEPFTGLSGRVARLRGQSAAEIVVEIFGTERTVTVPLGKVEQIR